RFPRAAASRVHTAGRLYAPAFAAFAPLVARAARARARLECAGAEASAARRAGALRAEARGTGRAFACLRAGALRARGDAPPVRLVATRYSLPPSRRASRRRRTAVET